MTKYEQIKQTILYSTWLQKTDFAKFLEVFIKSRNLDILQK